MSVYLHKTLQCLVTETNYTEFGISSLEDPDMYRIVDMPEDIDFLKNNITFGEPTWHDEDKTVFVYPVIAAITEEYKQHLIDHFRNSCFDDLIENGFSAPWQSFVYIYKGETYRFPIDITQIIEQCKTDNYPCLYHACHIPVLRCDKDDPATVLDKHILLFDDTELREIHKAYRLHVLQVCTASANRYHQVCDMPYETIVENIKQKNATDGIVPNDMADEVVFKKDKDTVNRTVRKK